MAAKEAKDGTDASEGAPEGAAAEAAPKSRKKLIIMAAAALLVLGGGAGGYFALFGKKADAQKDKDAAVAAKPPVFMDLPEVMVNLSAGPGERVQYLKVKVVLEIKEQPLAAQIQPVLPRVTDTFQTYLRELRPSDLAGSSGLYRLREELTRRVNAAIAPNHVNAVLFKEVLVQ